MRDHEWLAERFEENRTQLRAVAYRMLGSLTEADDAVQEGWLRLSRSDTSGVENLSGWLTTVVGRVCLDMLRSRKVRREEPLDPSHPGDGVRGVAGADRSPGRHGIARTGTAGGVDPEEEAMLADSVGLALLVVLEALTPAERLAFVLHDMFAVPFDEIAPIVGRTPNATKMLASRARRRIEGAGSPGGLNVVRDPEQARGPEVARHRKLVDAFLAASRGGDFEALVAVLDPDVVLRADATTVQMGAAGEVRGAAAVAETFAGRARGATPALIDGAVGAVWRLKGTPRVVFGFTFEADRIVAITMESDPARLSDIDLVVLR